MFNLKNASSKIKKAAYRAGVRSGKYDVRFNTMPYETMVTVYSDNGKIVELTQIDVELACDYTWREIKSGMC